jgi:hypothetical protein
LGQLSGAKNLLAKLNFPREALILSGIIKWGFNAGIKMLILIPALFLRCEAPTAQILVGPHHPVGHPAHRHGHRPVHCSRSACSTRTSAA